MLGTVSNELRWTLSTRGHTSVQVELNTSCVGPLGELSEPWAQLPKDLPHQTFSLADFLHVLSR